MEALLTVAVPAVVKLLESLNNKEWDKVLKICIAALAGAALGYVTGDVAGIANGVITGLAGSGIVTVAGKVSPKRD